MNLNLYEELGINNCASKDEIKNAFKNLSLKYHPDKNPDENLNEKTNKYIKIKNAYEILYNEKSRVEYDLINSNKSSSLYNFIKNIINDPNLNIFFETITRNKNSRKYLELNIIETITCDIEDRYYNKLRKLVIKRKTRDSTIVYVPLCDNISIFKNDGEIDKDDEIYGDIIINVVLNKSSEYEYKEYDLIKYIEIPIYEYMYGGIIIVDHFDDIFEINHDGFINKKNNIIINNKGLPKIKGKTELRGDLVIYVNIENFNEDFFKERIKNLFEK